MNMIAIVNLVTIIITYIFGIITKKVSWLEDDYIPLQNLVIGIVAGIICAGLKIDNMNYLTSIVTCTMSAFAAGGLYDGIKTVNTIKEK